MSGDLNKIFKKISDLPYWFEVSPVTATTRNLIGETPLHVAAIWGDVEAIRLLLLAGASIDAKGEGGNTPLHEAINQGNLDAVRFLVESGASLYAENDEKETPLQSIDFCENKEIVKFISNYDKRGK